MTSTAKEVIRDIKLYELGIKDKLDGYDTLMSLRGLKAFKTKVNLNEIHYGKVNDIKFIHYNGSNGSIYIKYELWRSIEDSFNLSYIETRELTMWAIGSDPNLEGIPTVFPIHASQNSIGSDPNLEDVTTRHYGSSRHYGS